MNIFSRSNQKRGVRMADSGPHLAIDTWLKNLDLPDYARFFSKYTGVEDILHFTERDLKTHGIRNSAHRARIMTSLVVLREKYTRGMKPKIGSGFPSKSTSCCNLTIYNGKPFSGQRSWPPSGKGSPASSGIPSRRTSMEPVVGPNATPEELKAALEWELSLDWRDLRSHPWYHGTIPRQRAENLVSQDGDFLVRDYVSRPGDYVLTCFWANSSLHFVINKVIVQANTIYERIQYQFEKETFDTVPDLITYFVGNKCPIAPSLGATIFRPINRHMPLTYYMSCFGLDCQMQYVAKALGSPQRTIPTRTPPAIPEKETSVPPDLPQKTRGITIPNSERTRGITVPKSEKTEEAPPKPSRVPSRKYSQKPKVVVKRLPSLEDNEDLVDISAFNETVNGKHQEHSLVVGNKSRKSSGETRYSFLDRKVVDADYNKVKPFTIPPVDPPSAFDLLDYKTSFLGLENKPLDISAMCKTRNILMESGSRILAAHLTKVDLDLLMHGKQVDLGLGVVSGLELLLLPQGEKLRKDVLERIQCMKSFIVITILMCPTQMEMVEMLNKWIAIAVETKAALGNLYGFAYIMQGLAHSQLTRLRNVWLSLRRMYTESAFNYETKLKPALKAMQECTNVQSSNTCIPYLTALVPLFDIPVKGNSEEGTVEMLDSPSELSSVDYGLQMLLNHLTYGRQMAQQCANYTRNGEAILDNVDYNNELLDVFRTEFHLKLLWGSRGASADPVQRHDKFSQLLSLISQRIE